MTVDEAIRDAADLFLAKVWADSGYKYLGKVRDWLIIQPLPKSPKVEVHVDRARRGKDMDALLESFATVEDLYRKEQEV